MIARSPFGSPVPVPARPPLVVTVAALLLFFAAVVNLAIMVILAFDQVESRGVESPGQLLFILAVYFVMLCQVGFFFNAGVAALRGRRWARPVTWVAGGLSCLLGLGCGGLTFTFALQADFDLGNITVLLELAMCMLALAQVGALVVAMIALASTSAGAYVRR